MRFAKNYFAQPSTIKRFLMHGENGQFPFCLGLAACVSLLPALHAPRPIPRRSYASQVHRFSVNRNADNYTLRLHLSLSYISHFLSRFPPYLPFFDDLLKPQRLAPKRYRFTVERGKRCEKARVTDHEGNEPKRTKRTTRNMGGLADRWWMMEVGGGRSDRERVDG